MSKAFAAKDGYVFLAWLWMIFFIVCGERALAAYFRIIVTSPSIPIFIIFEGL